MKSARIFIFFAAISAVQCGGSSRCEPFVSNYQAFQQVWLNYYDQFVSVVADTARAHPVLGSALFEFSMCQADPVAKFFENTIVRLSGANASDVAGILENMLSSEFKPPIDCISNEIIFIQQHIYSNVEFLVPLLQNYVPSEITLNDCADVRSTLQPFAEVGNVTVQRFGEIFRYNRHAFASLGLGDLFVESLQSVIPCLLRGVGIVFGSLLNADGSPVTQFLAGEITVVPYPFSCSENALNLMKDYLLPNFSNFIFEA